MHRENFSDASLNIFNLQNSSLKDFEPKIASWIYRARHLIGYKMEENSLAPGFIETMVNQWK